MSEPAVGVEQALAERSGEAWRIMWRLRNAGGEAIAIHSAWLPHGRFRSREWQLEPPLRMEPGAESLLESYVAWDEPPGAVVENGFLSLRLEGWRVFARLTITALPDGSPSAVAESITVDRMPS